MATRATYQFNTEDYSVTFYIHWDGYPKGAAHYFLQMLLSENKRGDNGDRFLRANSDAYLTGSHDDHGDIEYRYTVNCGETVSVLAESVEGLDNLGRAFTTTIYQGDLANFINSYYPNNLLVQVIDETPYQCLMVSLTESLKSVQTLLTKEMLVQNSYSATNALTIAQKMMLVNRAFGYEHFWKKEVITPLETIQQWGINYVTESTFQRSQIFALLEGIYAYLELHLDSLQKSV